MKRHLRVAALMSLAGGLAAAGAYAHPAFAKRMAPFRRPSAQFALLGKPLGGAKAAPATPAFLTASRVAAVANGALVIDEDSGDLIRADADGKPVAKLPIGRQAGLLAYDAQAKRAYVADRVGNRLAIVDVGDTLSVVRSIATPVEPYGVALTPDRATVLVTTIADRTLVAYDATTGTERWRAALGREPRGIAVSPDGSRALVATLATGTVDTIDLTGRHAVERIALATTPQSGNNAQRIQKDCFECDDLPAPAAGNQPSFARAAFAVTFMGAHEAVVPFQRETPVQIAGTTHSGGYGGGFEPPIVHQLAFLGIGGKPAQAGATVAQHEPHALAWDGVHDALYVAGLGDDSVVQIKNASQMTISAGATFAVQQPGSKVDGGSERCGPDGLALADNGDVWVWCSFTRSLDRVVVTEKSGALAAAPAVSHGPELVASAFSVKQHLGLVMFHASDSMISTEGALACASCHPDGRADGLTWKIENSQLQTPVLAGRLVGTHPFKWDGGDKDLPTSLTTTMKRLGGTGLVPELTADLSAYLEALPRPAAPTQDATAVARGKQLFEGELGCRGCHDGAAYTDRQRHEFASTLAEAKTPSLIGLAASAPYYHDGSAPSLEALLRDRAKVHGMADTSKLTDRQVADLSAFLNTL
jgi:sugar lactone lactonase YvrE